MAIDLDGAVALITGVANGLDAASWVVASDGGSANGSL
jgi:hypothetical protein